MSLRYTGIYNNMYLIGKTNPTCIEFECWQNATIVNLKSCLDISVIVSARLLHFNITFQIPVGLMEIKRDLSLLIYVLLGNSNTCEMFTCIQMRSS